MIPEKPFLVCSDFDGTLTRREDSVIPFVTRRMSPASQARLAASNATYEGRFHRANFTHDEGRYLIRELCEIYVAERLHERLISEAVAGVKLRDGVVDWLKEMRVAGVKVIVVSFAVKQVIQSVLLRNNVLHLVDCVCAASLVFDAEGRVCGYDPGSLVHPMIKGEVSRLVARMHKVPVANILSCGDSPGDKHLGGYKTNRLGLAHEESDIPILRPHFGQIVHLKDHSFRPAAAWFRQKLRLGP